MQNWTQRPHSEEFKHLGKPFPILRLKSVTHRTKSTTHAVSVYFFRFVALVLGDWSAGKRFVGPYSKFVSEILLRFGQLELINQVIFPYAVLLEFAD